VYAVLDELVGGKWITVDSLKIIDGVQKEPSNDCECGGGGGSGVNNPDPTLGGTPFDPVVLSSLAISGSATVSDASPTQFMATAT
jgi:hypothetical protein